MPSEIIHGADSMAVTRQYLTRESTFRVEIS